MIQKTVDILSTISTLIQREGLIKAGDVLVLAVSGGPDSLAMLYALNALRAQMDFHIHVAHLDHKLRPESADEAHFVVEQAQSLGLTYTLSALDVGAEARRTGLNVYAAGRRARYQLLSALSIQLGAASVAVAHTANDQAETVLLHLLRGAGTEGLAAMSISTPWEQWAVPGGRDQKSGIRDQELTSSTLIRPLLETSRAQIEAYCVAMGLEPRRDPANQDTRHMRSRIRHHLLPQLIEYNPHIVEALCRTATICNSDQAFLQSQLDSIWDQLVSVQSQGLAFTGAIWQRLPVALQRLALRRAHSLLSDSGKTLELNHIEEARRLITLSVGRQSQLPAGIQLRVGYGQDFVLHRLGSSPTTGPQLQKPAQVLEPPASIDLAGWTLYASLEEQAQQAHNSWEIWIDPQAIADQSLTLRRRNPGDRMRPAAGSGSRSIQDLMVDAKLPRELRAAWPILVSNQGIIWVPGLRAAQGVSCAQGQGPALWVRIVLSSE